MNTFKKTPLALLLPVLLVGCGGGGGSVDLMDVPEGKPDEGSLPESNKPNYKTVEAPKAKDFSETGFTVLAPLKDLDKDGVDALTKLYTVNPDKHTYYRDEQYDTIMVGGKEININAYKVVVNPNKSKVEWDQVRNIKGDDKTVGYVVNGVLFAYDNETGDPLIKVTEYDHTRVGLLQMEMDGKSRNTLFYRGKDKTLDTPVSGTAKYDGHWEFVHQLHGQDTENTAGGIGNQTAANKASFTADFSTKKLTGKLTTKSDTAEIDYTVDADIYGNSFTGTGKGSYDFDRGRTPENGKSDDSKAAVSGSFYGDSAAELAGRLVENDNAFVGAFAARQSGQTDLKTDGDLFQAGVMNFNKVGDTDSYKLGEYQGTNFSGDIKKLQIDGEVIDLEGEALSDNVQSMQFGKLQQEDSQTAQYYVQGYLTKKSDVPTTGKAEYAGHWSGYGEGDAVFSGDKMDARFSADWASKKLDGKLYNANQAIESESAIAFSADINGNAFSGATNRFKLSTNTGSLDSKPITGEANISGHFYGDKANELGGYIRKEDGTFGGVFGAKQLKQD